MVPMLMVTINRKKGTMQIAKYCTLIIFFLLYQNLSAQGLQGKYYGDDGLIYYFDKSTFKTVTRHVGFHSDKKVSKGSYKVNQDTLFLKFEPIENYPVAKLEFTQKESINNIVKGDTLSQDSTISIGFKVVGINDKPINPSPILQIRNKNDQVIQGFWADSLGYIDKIFIFGSFEGSFLFTSLANEEFRIEADTLMGFKSKVKVTLPERKKYNDYNGTKKYFIKKRTKFEVVLENPETNKKVTLKRKESG